MASAAHLFYKPNSSDTLYTRIRPDADDEAFLQEKWRQLASFLVKRFSKEHDCSSYTWIQGSYKYGTLIRPIETRQDYDVDLGFYAELPDDVLEKADKARALKQSVREALMAYRFDDTDVSDVAPPKERCERIRYEQQHFHIDVPCYRIQPQIDRRDLATETKGWEQSDPKLLYTWFKKTADDAGRVRRLICYFKMWSALRHKSDTGKPSSILLTVLVCAAFNSLDKVNRDLPEDELFRRVVIHIRARLAGNPQVHNPVNQAEDLNRLSDTETASLIDKLDTLRSISDRAIAEVDPERSSIIWSEAFMHYMPIGSPSTIREAMKAVFATPQPQINIAIFDKPRDGKRIAQYNNAVPSVNKKRVLNFSVSNAQQFPGASYQWIVRNSGAEAGAVNDLGHVATSNGPANSETTAYAGTHFMDCVIRRNGDIIGFRRVPVTVRNS